MGGKAAVEMRYAGQVAEGCSDDIARAVNCIREAAAKEGALGFSLLNVESDSSSNMSESLNARSEAAVQAELERYYGRRCTKKRKLYNGMIKCNLFMYF